MGIVRPDWVPDAVFYQIFPDRFRNGDPANDPPVTVPWGTPPDRTSFQGGDLAGIRQGLPYLRDLGVTALYLTPIFAAGSTHRYDTHDYLRVDPALGDETLLTALVADAHAGGVRVILDGVFNHAGDGFWPFRDLLANGADSVFRDWFLPTTFPVRQDPPNYQTCGGAAFLPKLNTDNPAVAEFLIGVGTHWLERSGIDGWRLDVPWKVSRAFWLAFRDAVRSRWPDAFLAGEFWRDAEPWLDVFDGAMNYPLRECILDFCVRDDMDAEDFIYQTDRLFAYPAAAWQLNLLGSHDTARLLTVCKGDEGRAILALTALFIAPGAPMIYYGDELGLLGDNDPGCRGAMPWNPGSRSGPIFAACRRLIALRHELPALRRGSWEPILVFNGLLAVLRRHDDGDVVTIFNPRDARRDVSVPVPAGDSIWTDRLADRTYVSRNGQLTIPEVPRGSAMILVRQPAI